MSENKIPFKYITRIAQNKSVKIVSEFINSVFMVESLDYAAGIKENGAAFCISPNHFLTCAHVIKKYDKNKGQNIADFIGKSAPIISLIHDGKKIKVVPIAVNIEWDIALLTADINVKSFELDLDYKTGEDILTIGSPHGYENNVSSGIIGSLNRSIYIHTNAPTYTFVDLTVFPGSSGGPVIKESNGKVVGMVTLIISASGEYGLNAALPSNYIKQFCQKHLDIFK
jgi:S1-C subfamily serine protease